MGTLIIFMLWICCNLGIESLKRKKRKYKIYHRKYKAYVKEEKPESSANFPMSA